MYGDTEFEKCLQLYASNKRLPSITAGSKTRLDFIAARALIRRFTVIIFIWFQVSLKHQIQCVLVMLFSVYPGYPLWFFCAMKTARGLVVTLGRVGESTVIWNRHNISHIYQH